MTIDEFKKEIEKLNIVVSKHQEQLLEKYYSFLSEYNKHTNLTAITTKEDVYLKHFYDSLTVSKAIDLNQIESLIDIGSGAGFPGVVLKIFYPHLKLTLLDSNNKKTQFLKELMKILELSNVEIVNQRAEDYAKAKIGKYDLCISRAVAYIDIITSLSLPFIKKEGKVILMKGKLVSEIDILKKYSKQLGIKDYYIENFVLPNTKDERNLVIIQKADNIKILNYNQIIKRNKKWLEQK